MASLLPAPVFIRAGGEIAEAPAPLGVASVALRFATDSAACFMGFLVFRHHVNSSGGEPRPIARWFSISVGVASWGRVERPQGKRIGANSPSRQGKPDLPSSRKPNWAVYRRRY